MRQESHRCRDVANLIQASPLKSRQPTDLEPDSFPDRQLLPLFDLSDFWHSACITSEHPAAIEMMATVSPANSPTCSSRSNEIGPPRCLSPGDSHVHLSSQYRHRVHIGLSPCRRSSPGAMAHHEPALVLLTGPGVLHPAFVLDLLLAADVWPDIWNADRSWCSAVCEWPVSAVLSEWTVHHR